MTTASKTRRDQMVELKDAIEEIDADMDGVREELKDALEALKEIRQRIANLKEDKAWRVSAWKFLKAQK